MIQYDWFTLTQLDYLHLILDTLFYISPAFFVHAGITHKYFLRPWSGILLATVFSYVFGNLAIHTKWAYRNVLVNSYEEPTEQHFMWAVSDGANLTFWLVLGWIPALIIVLLWFWFIRYVRK